MKINYFELLLNKDTCTPYLAGEDIIGDIEIHVYEKTKMARLTIRLVGYVHTAWRNKSNDIHFESRDLIMDEYLDLTT